MKRITYILMLLLIVLLTACSHISPSLSNADGGVTKAMAEQVEYDMSYEDVCVLLGSAGDVESGTMKQTYVLTDGGAAYFL